jgi:hypothetical protein
MTEERLVLVELLEKAGDGDFLRAVAEAVLQLLMESDVDGLIGAARYERRLAEIAGNLAARAAGVPWHVTPRHYRAGRLGYRGQGRRGPADWAGRSIRAASRCTRLLHPPVGRSRCTICSASRNACRSMVRSSCSTAPDTAAC